MNVSNLKIPPPAPPQKKNRNEFDMYQTRITFNSVKNESKSYNNIKPLAKKLQLYLNITILKTHLHISVLLHNIMITLIIVVLYRIPKIEACS